MQRAGDNNALFSPPPKNSWRARGTLRGGSEGWLRRAQVAANAGRRPGAVNPTISGHVITQPPFFPSEPPQPTGRVSKATGSETAASPHIRRTSYVAVGSSPSMVQLAAPGEIAMRAAPCHGFGTWRYSSAVGEGDRGVHASVRKVSPLFFRLSIFPPKASAPRLTNTMARCRGSYSPSPSAGVLVVGLVLFGYLVGRYYLVGRLDRKILLA